MCRNSPHACMHRCWGNYCLKFLYILIIAFFFPYVNLVAIKKTILYNKPITCYTSLQKERKFMMAKNEEPLEEMTVELSLDNGQDVTCAVITILEVEGQDYIVLLPLDEKGENQEGEVWFYRYSENPDDPNEEPELDYIDSDEEYEKVADAFDEFLDNQEFDEFLPDEE